jgi:hypothetical protein
MPKINTAGIVKVTLPSSIDGDPAIVEINKGISVGSLVDIDESASNMEKSLQLLTKAIISWNITGSDDQILPITVESVKQLQVTDFTFLSKQIDYGQLTKGEEKKIDDVSSEPSEGTEAVSQPTS